MNKYLFICSLFFLFPMFFLNAENGKEYVCGIANGFPPYQYILENGDTAGLDYEVAELVFKTAGIQFKFFQFNWDDLMFGLAHQTGQIDLLCGAEINEERSKLFDFSVPYYQRRTGIFVLQDSSIDEVSDLFGAKVTGDRHSVIEKYLAAKGVKGKIRIIHTVSKEESFSRLRDGRVVAVIAPLEVGYYLSGQMKIKVRVLEDKDDGAPVGFAVEKGNKALLLSINATLNKLIADGKIEKLLMKYSSK